MIPRPVALQVVSERLCIRCDQPVLLQDGQLVFCSHCGAPQIYLSEQLQMELEEQTRAFAEQGELREGSRAGDRDGEAAGKRRGGAFGEPWRGEQHAWTLGVRYALLSAAVTLGLGLLSLLVPPVSLLLLLWIVSAPILTVSFLQARQGTAPARDLGFAARLGLLTGLLVAVGSGAVFTLNLVLSRFFLHDAGTLDAQLTAAFAQQRIAVLARLGAEAQPTLDMFAVPEFRVGLLLSVLLISALVYLLLSTVAGGLAGLILRRRTGA